MKSSLLHVVLGLGVDLVVCVGTGVEQVHELLHQSLDILCGHLRLSIILAGVLGVRLILPVVAQMSDQLVDGRLSGLKGLDLGGDIPGTPLGLTKLK